MEAIYELQASVLRMLAHPRRLEMLHVLADGPIEVGRLADRLGISQPNASQHLAQLRSAGLVELERNGRSITVVAGDAFVSALLASGVGVVTAAAPLRYVDDQLLSELLAG